MIYLLDEPLHPTSHSHLMSGVIREHTKETIVYVELLPSGNIISILTKLLTEVTPSDIVLCPWAIPGNASADVLFGELTERCWVVAAAGNNGRPIEDWTPTRVDGVIVVGALNKAGFQASHSNFSTTKKLKWVVGTNYRVGNRVGSGTSISAALYAAFLAESIRAKDGTLLDTLIERHALTQKT